ncbi:MAG: glycine cleavage system aminomethyltransferase GcvT [Porticoccaceae bacterium]
MSKQLNQTGFYQYHLDAGAKMVPFAGYKMPINYAGGIIEEHLHTRESAGLFDVSHMGQLIITGDNIAEQLEALMPVDLEVLKPHQMTYSTLTNSQGGIIDDLIITRWDENTFFVVVNAACKQQDIAHFKQHLPGAQIDVLEQQGLLALQGPKAVDVISQLAPEATNLHFMNGCSVNLNGTDCYITRSGYTGEDGFEISIDPKSCSVVVDALLANQAVRWVGLGARDSLRLEAGLCLYGHDMNTETSPVEASLLWSISKSRRSGGNKQGGFLGADRILEDIAAGASQKRVGFVVEGRAPVREGAEIIDQNGNQIGTITSGGFSPSLQMPIAMGYIATEFSAVDTQVNAVVRGKSRPLTVSALPLVPQRYYRG